MLVRNSNIEISSIQTENINIEKLIKKIASELVSDVTCTFIGWKFHIFTDCFEGFVKYLLFPLEGYHVLNFAKTLEFFNTTYYTLHE